MVRAAIPPEARVRSRPMTDVLRLEEAALHRHADALVAALAAALEDDHDAEPALIDHGPFVARRMLDWKLGCGDRRLERWTLGDLRELLLDWLPRKVSGDDVIAVAADAVTAFLGLLEQRELLDAPVPLASLESAVARLRPRFEEACG
jgi:hypothetical protein